MTAATPRARRLAFTGAAAVLVYVGLAAVSGHMSVLARRPLLEGVGPPPVYNFVAPPASVAATNKTPYSLTKAISLAPPERGAGVFGTSDLQAQLVLDPASFPSSAGSGSVTLTITPLDPSKLAGTVPAGYTIMGNAYRFRITTKAGADVPPFVLPAHLVITYPSDALYFTSAFATHTIVRLGGSAWTAVPTSDSPVAQQAAADVTTLGTFTVVGKAVVLKKKSSVGLIIGIAAGAVVVLAAVVFALRGRARRKRPGAAAKERRPRT